MNIKKLKISKKNITGIAPKHLSLLQSELGINYFEDLLYLFPYKYIDRSKYYKIEKLHTTSSEVQIIGRITHLRKISQGRRERLEATFSDGQSQMQLVWFRVPKWLQNSIKVEEPYVIFGKCKMYNKTFQMAHPEMELLSTHQAKRRPHILAVYPSTEKLSKSNLSSRHISSYIKQLFSQIQGKIEETLSLDILSRLGLVSKSEALIQVHFPSSQEALSQAKFRLKFEELLFIQLQLLRKNMHRKETIKGFPFKKVGIHFNHFYKNILPFTLTNAQKKVIKEIRKDLGNHTQMNRLLQGDVGSGKTIVALLSVLIALDNDYQGCVLAPTEILAVQHFNSFKSLLRDTDIKIALLTGSTKLSERKTLLEDLKSSKLQILIGTHAILEDRVVFDKLGIAIIDEQHRFGVAQRSKLWTKNTLPPHILVMTATPIPRTLAMNLYGDLDISIIDELPPGRKPIKTFHKYESHRLQVLKFIKSQIDDGHQVYVVYPLIEGSETMDYKNLHDGYLSLERYFPKPKYQISVVHGKMKPADKDFEIERFKKKQTHIMVATTVIEVGVDIPNASTMVIESAERFGLSQLHQLRGRVGRGAEQSYCILVTDFNLSKNVLTRLRTMEETNDGFKISEVDLKLRGPGDLMGTQQSGILNLKIADLTADQDILRLARQCAFEVLEEDPHLEKAVHSPMKNHLEQLEKSIWKLIS